MALKMQCLGKTDVGLKRANNEDAFLVRPDLGFCAVADGMGGAAAGEIASRIFVEAAQELFTARRPAGESPAERVKQAFTLANTRILAHIADQPQDAGMGCTAELIALAGDDIVIGHVGDSRTYRLRQAELRQLTQDHSLVQEQVNQGLISADEARRHPLRHVILRAVGTKETTGLDVLTGTGLPGDIFLLCSDGLSDMVDDAALQTALNTGGDLPVLADRLIDLAKAGGGKDNVTVVLVRLVEGV